MAIRNYKELKRLIQQHGFFYFFKVKVTEQILKRKIKKFGVQYPVSHRNMDTLNNESVNKDSFVNQATPYYNIQKLFAATGLDYETICLLDIGCGYGKVINLGMLLKFKQVIGIDLDESVIDKAIANCTLMQKMGCKTIFEIHQEDASKYIVPKSINVIFLANPFGQKTMEEVLENIVRHQKNNGNQLYVAYYMPTYQELFAAYKNCVKIFEYINTKRNYSEMVLFKFN